MRRFRFYGRRFGQPKALAQEANQLDRIMAGEHRIGARDSVWTR
jgi:hypothetical protein